MPLSNYEELLHLAVEGAELGIWSWDLKTGKVKWNHHLYKLLGRPYKKDELLNGEAFFEYIHPDDSQRVSDHLDGLIKSGGSTFKDEFRIQYKKSEEIHWLAAVGRLYRDNQGEAIRISGINFEITKRKHAEEALLQNQYKFQTLVENSPDIIARFNRQLQYTYINQSITHFTGMSPDHYVGKAINEWGLPEDLCELWENAILKVFNTGRIFTFFYYFPGKDQNYYFQTKVVPEIRENGQTESVLAVTRDMTQVRFMEQKLREERDLLETVMNNTSAHIAYLDSEFNFVMVNDVYAKGSGYSKEALIGRNHFDFFPDAENQAIFEKVRRTGNPYFVKAKPFEIPGDPQKNVTYWDWVLVPLKDQEEELKGLVFSLVDVTKEQQIIAEHEAYIAEIQRLNQSLVEKTTELEVIFSALADPVLVLDADRKLVKANFAASNVLEIDALENIDANLINKLFSSVDGDLSFSDDDRLLDRIFSGQTIKDETYIFKKNTNDSRFILISASPVRKLSEITGAVITWHDITERRLREEALLNSEERYTLAQKLSGVGNWDWDIRTGQFEWSEPVSKLLGVEQEDYEHTYHSFLKWIHPKDKHLVTEAINACVEEGLPYYVEHRVLRPDGKILWLRQTGNVIRDKNNLAIRMLGMVQDITHRKKAEENQHLLAEIVAESQDAIIVRDIDNYITLWNAGAEKIYGYTTEEMTGKSIDRIIPADKRQEENKLLERVQKGEHIRHFETVRIKQDGAMLYIAMSMSPLRDDNNKVYAIASIEHDISPRIEAEKQLLSAKDELEIRVKERTCELQEANVELQEEIDQRISFQKKLSFMAEELIRAEEKERRTIAAGLHDKIIQMLIFSNIKLDQVAKRVAAKEDKLILEDIREKLDETTHELRTMTFELSPPVLYELGLIPALQWLAERFEDVNQVSCEFYAEVVDETIPENLRNMLYRSVNELLNNIRKHARARHVNLQVNQKGKVLQITIEDDGYGFDPKTLKSDFDTSSGFGLFNIEERIRLLNGKFKISSSPGKGTLVQLSLPINQLKKEN